MTDTTPAHNGPTRAGESTWVLPLLVLAPAAAIRQFTEHSTPWLVTSWVFCVLSAVFLAVGWVTVLRHGVRSAGVWVTCALAHAVLAAQIIWLVWN